MTKKNLRDAVGYLANRLAAHNINLNTIFVINWNILCSLSRKGRQQPAMCFRITTKTNYYGDEVCVASPPSTEHSKQEYEELKKLGGDVLATYEDYERHDLGDLYLSASKMKAYQKKRTERLELEKQKNAEMGEQKKSNKRDRSELEVDGDDEGMDSESASKTPRLTM